MAIVLQMGQQQMGMKEAMKKMREQTAEMALNAQRDAEAAAAEREAAEAQLAETQAAVEAEQNNVKSVEVTRLADCCKSSAPV